MTATARDVLAQQVQAIHKQTGLPVAAIEDLLVKLDWTPEQLMPPALERAGAKTGRKNILSPGAVAAARARLAADPDLSVPMLAVELKVAPVTLYRALKSGAGPRRAAGTGAAAAAAPDLPEHYDKESCITVGELKPLLDPAFFGDVPDFAWAPASTVRLARVVDDRGEEWAIVFGAPFSWDGGGARMAAAFRPFVFGGA